MLLLLILLLGAVAVGRYYEPIRDRSKVLAAARGRDARARHVTPTPDPSVPEEAPDELEAIELEEVAPSFEDWFRDDDLDPRRCSFDGDLGMDRRLTLRHQRLDNGMTLLMSKSDIAFLAWTAWSYRLNPHFLLGIMMAESGGDCSAVSSAGAQGCFQITYRQGAGQLKNSFAERVTSWYWAKRSNGGEAHRRPGEALGYWPADLYVPPSKHFGRAVKKGTRQLRMTLDPAATLLTSDRLGDTEVSSVANFSFGVVGAGLYFHFLNHYLYSHEAQLKGDVFDLTSSPGMKAFWMAASYNQGSPRTMRQLGTYGPKQFQRHMTPDVIEYGQTVADYCMQFQTGDKTYGGTMTFGEFSDFVQQLRWTYSEIPIDWEGLQSEIKRRFFADENTLDLETELLLVFQTLRTLEPKLSPEQPRVDHRVRF